MTREWRGPEKVKQGHAARKAAPRPELTLRPVPPQGYVVMDSERPQVTQGLQSSPRSPRALGVE